MILLCVCELVVSYVCLIEGIEKRSSAFVTVPDRVLRSVFYLVFVMEIRNSSFKTLWKL